MALNLSDPGAILRAYESIINDGAGNDWLLLKYSSHDEVFLAAHGSGGLRELTSKVEDLDRIFFAFYRQEREEDPGFVIITYIPLAISGVKRARALVHSRRVGTIFKRHHATLTVEDISQITVDAVCQTIDPEFEDPSVSVRYTSSHTSDSSDLEDMGRAPFQTISASGKTKSPPSHRTGSPPFSPNHAPSKQAKHPSSPAVEIVPVRRAFSETQYIPEPKHDSSASPIEPVRRSNSQDPSFPPPPPAKPSGVLAFIRGRKGSKAPPPELQRFQVDEEAPPIPPKEHHRLPLSHQEYHYRLSPRVLNISEFALISHVGHEQIPEYPQEQFQSAVQTVPLRGKWEPQVTFEERLKQRREAEERRRQEEEEALMEENRRKEEARRRKEEQRLEAVEEDERRRMELEDELRRAAQGRKLREQMEKHEEERKRLELEERKRVAKARRMEEHRRLEEWRREQVKLANEAAKKDEEARKKEEFERQQKIQLAEAKVKSGRDVGELVTGWVTIQTNDSVTWKRRFYKFAGTTMYLYRTPKDMPEHMDKVELRGKLRGLREWKEGYEELEAIPFSFAMEFSESDQRGVWSMYADSEEEKYKLLGLLHYAAGL